MSVTQAAVSQVAAQAPTPARPRRFRLTSLDVARGLFLIISVTTVSVLPPRPAWLLHAPWFGVTPYDLIFPLFVTLSGIGLAFAYRKPPPNRVTVRRVLVLCVVGVIYNIVSSGSAELSTIRITGVLQLYAVLVLISALLHLVVRSAQGWAILTVAAAVGLTALYWWFESRCTIGVLSPECNPSRIIDGAIFGEHMWNQGTRGHDPEGLVAIGGAFITAAAGTTAGHLALSARTGSPRRALTLLAAWTTACALMGLALAQVVEPFKRLWTPGFGLLTASLGLLIFVSVFSVVDVWWRRIPYSRQQWITWPLEALGRNSLLVYFGSHLLVLLLLRYGNPSYAERIGRAVAGESGAQIAFVLLSLALWWVLAMILHRARIYVRP